MFIRTAAVQGRQRCVNGRILSRSTASSIASFTNHILPHTSDRAAEGPRCSPMVTRRFSSTEEFSETRCENKDLAPRIRSCRSEYTAYDMESTSFHVWFLGTGGSAPSRYRNTSSTLLQLGGQSFLFDAGEGIQRQFIFTRHRPSDITKIFISHMHADHVLGLPGLLLMTQLAGRYSQKDHVVEVYGPPGIYNYIASTMALTRTRFAFVKVVVYELVGGDADQDFQRHSPEQSIHYGDYPELSNPVLVRKTIERNDDGTWTIERPSERHSKDKNLFDVDRGSNRPMFIDAAEVKHLERVQTFGFVVREPDPIYNIDPKKAISLGVAPGKKYRLLKNGFPVMSDDGTLEVRPEQVLVGANRKARKFACIGDNSELSPAMMELCMGADVLVHEATGAVVSAAEARKRGHASAEMAGSVAKRVKAQVLALNHISGGSGPMDLKHIVRRAEEANDGVSSVILTHDFMELVVPRLGFDFVHEEEPRIESLFDW